MFDSPASLKAYVQQNYPEVTDNRINNDHWDLLCTKCKVVRGFRVIKHDLSGTRSKFGEVDRFSENFYAPSTYLFVCPVCQTFKQWIVYKIELPSGTGGKSRYHYFRVTSVPSEGLEEIDELPADPPQLREAYRQAIRAMDANAHLAAAAMFRRALQVITRDILGARPGNLANELNEVVGKAHNGGVVTKDFATVGYIVKEAGNQGAHPDKDPDLLEFEPGDAQDLQTIFMELVGDLFVVPAAKERQNLVSWHDERSRQSSSWRLSRHRVQAQAHPGRIGRDQGW